MQDRISNREHWEQVGRSYSASWEPPAKQLLSHRELGFILRHLRMTPARTALDIGIGNGRILEAVLSDNDITRVHGLDIAGEMVTVCRRRFEHEPRDEGL